MKRLLSWTLVLAFVLSVVIVPVASATVDRTQDESSWVSSWLQDALAWLTTAISGADESTTSPPARSPRGHSQHAGLRRRRR